MWLLSPGQSSHFPHCLAGQAGFEGFNKDQERKLKFKKKMPHSSEPDKWVEIYQILFPEDDFSIIPSPCKSYY
jgi:hypothetical protein